MRKLCFVLAFLLLTSAYAVAQSEGRRKDITAGTAKQLESLRGLKGISLTVDLFDRDRGMEAAERLGVLKVLQDEAEALIQKAGIRLLKSTEIENAGSHNLRMLITVSKPNGFGYPLVSELKLFQQANLVRDPSIEMSLVTWETHGVGTPEVNLAMLRSQLSSEVGRFIEDYLAANPQL